jgi:hypothetical protein
VAGIITSRINQIKLSSSIAAEIVVIILIEETAIVVVALVKEAAVGSIGEAVLILKIVSEILPARRHLRPVRQAAQ